MKNIFTIFTREISAYFSSSIAYIFIIVFLLISMNVFMPQFFLVGSAEMRGYFYYLPIMLCIFLSAVTMRTWAEDRRGNTLELLLTFPMKTHQLVIGKYLAGLLFYIVALACTLTIPFMLFFLGRPDFGVITCQYVGAAFMGSFFIALGIFVSGFCRDQIISFILSMMASFLFFLIGVDFTAGSIDGWIPGFGTFLRNAIGMTQHFASFSKGVIDVRDILYYVMGSAIFLTLNCFWLESRLRPNAKSLFATGAAIFLSIFFVFNFLFTDISIGRFDITEGKIYTMSPASAEILKGLKAPVVAKLYISPQDKMPSGLKMLESEVRDKLDEFKVASKGKFDYKVFHLEAANVAGQEGQESLERSIEKKGVRPFQVRSIEADEMGVRLIYSAMTLSYKERPDEILPQITPGDLLDLEYKLVSKIFKMSLPEQPKVALVAPFEEKLPTAEMQEMMKKLGKGEADKLREDDYEFVQRLLEYEGYKVSRVRLAADDLIPDDTQTLAVIAPKDLNERQKYEISKFVARGGSLFLAVQRYTFDYKPFGAEGLKVSSVDQNPQIDQVLEKWGLAVDKDFLMDSQCEVVSLEGGKLYGLFAVSSPVKLPTQIRIVQEQMNKDVSITSRLSTMLYLWGSDLKLDEAKLKELNIRATPLLYSSPDAWTVPYHGGDLTGQDVAMPSFEKRKVFTLAALLEGQFPDAYKDKEVPAWPADASAPPANVEKPKENTAAVTPKPGKMIIIGCGRIFSKQLFQQGGHMNFLLNSVDALTLGEQLIKVRSKPPIDRSLKRLSSAGKALWRMFVTFLIPAILVAIGAFRLIGRRRSKWTYLKTV